jgi:GNAT superfamily N-acetyltransferase
MGGIRDGLTRDVPHPAAPWPLRCSQTPGRSAEFSCEMLAHGEHVCGCLGRPWTAMLAYRPAQLTDIPALMEIRGNVRENRLVNLRLGPEAYLQALTVEGRSWVCEDDGRVVGFVCGRPAKKDIWALFVCPEAEGRGIGTALMTLIENWMFAQGLDAITLTTAPGTRAERLYQGRGWKAVGPSGAVEQTYRLERGSPPPRP